MSGLGSDDDNTTDTPQGPALLAVSVITTVVALSVTLLRFCVRLRINRSVVWDDYFLGLAMVNNSLPGAEIGDEPPPARVYPSSSPTSLTRVAVSWPGRGDIHMG